MDRRLLIAASLIACCTPAAQATPAFTGTTAGTFATAVLAGTIVNTDGARLAVDNTTTGVYGGLGSGALRWGAFDTVQFPGVIAPGVPTHSDLLFTGNGYAADVGTVFSLGRLTFANGSSSNDTLIFGTDLHIATGAGQTPLVIAIGIHATVNGNLSADADADYLGFADIPATLHAYEGGTATAEVLGRFDSSGQLALVGLRYAGFNPDGSPGSGFVGRDGRSLPTPPALALVALGLAGLGVLRRKVA